MGQLFFGASGAHATVLSESWDGVSSVEVVDDQPISASDTRSLQMRLRPGEQWDPKCRSLADGLAYMAAQTDFDDAKGYFEKELYRLITDFNVSPYAVAIPRVKLDEIEVDAHYPDYDPLADNGVIPSIIREIDREVTLSFTTSSTLDPLLYAQLFGLPMRVVPKDQCCQPITAVPARPHKKKRIRKKWLKRYGWKVIYGPEKAWIVTDPVEGSLLCVGPDTYKKLKKARIDAKNVRIDVENVAADD